MPGSRVNETSSRARSAPNYLVIDSACRRGGRAELWRIFASQPKSIYECAHSARIPLAARVTRPAPQLKRRQ